MPVKAKKYLQNQSLSVAVRITDKRLKDAGVTLGKDLGIAERRPKGLSVSLPPTVTRRLVG